MLGNSLPRVSIDDKFLLPMGNYCLSFYTVYCILNIVVKLFYKHVISVYASKLVGIINIKNIKTVPYNILLLTNKLQGGHETHI